MIKEQFKVYTLLEILTPQEKRILHCIGKGYTNQQIADQLKLKESTIRTYNHTIFQKLQVKNRTLPQTAHGDHDGSPR